MSFTRVNVGGWGVGAQLTSAQQNQLDIDHANALDKTTAGDTINGTVVVTGAGIINASAGSASFTPTGVTANVQRGVRSTTYGGISLEGGATDYPWFSATRTRSLCASMVPMAISAGWSIGGNGWLIGPGNATTIYLSLPRCHNGATLSSIAVTMAVGSSHSGVPTLPTVTVYRLNLNSGVTTGSIFLSTTPVQSFTPTPGTGAAWYNSGLTQQLTYFCNQNNVIDNGQYAYTMALQDESGAGSIAGNIYLGTVMAYTAIADMRFP